MKSFFATFLFVTLVPVLNAFNIGYLSNDFGFPAKVDKFQWQELEEKGRTILHYSLDGHVAPGDWIGVTLVVLEREHLPPSCLERMRFEFNEGGEELSLFVMKEDLNRPLLRVSTSDLPMFLISNSFFVLEYNGLYRRYSENFEMKTQRPTLRSGKSMSRIDLVLLRLDPKKVHSPEEVERLLDPDSPYVIRPWSWKRRGSEP